MDREQSHQLQLLGFYGILRESFTITFSKRKIFSQITFLTIFPLCLLFLAHLQVSNFLFANIIHNEEALHHAQDFSSISGALPSEIVLFWLIKTAYLIFFLALSLLSTSAVVCTVACDYTRKETMLTDVMTAVVPNVWKRLLVTFAWSFIIVLSYNVVAFLVLLPSPLVSSTSPSPARAVFSGVLFVVYVVGFVYVSIIWHLATVVSVLEQECGIEAMMRSKELVRGKVVISGGVFLFLNSCFVLIQVGFERFVVVDVGGSFWGRIGSGIVGLLLLCGLTLLGLIVQTVVYFVCRTCQGEDVVGKMWSGHDEVEVYLGDYALLRSDEDVRFQQLYV
ncbi:uncharacterized protein LOC105178380 [Sesamum indicum]|uniref:Uncharacterized protein LOC105178380 n=1 Tax=Sesamum indicum TaxID=4182 RepID=A0A6I9UFI3_SESIN|nr:uncharacterized protein LOC105178380 [Sesamum indicum]